MSDSKNFFHMNVKPVKTGNTAERLKYNHRSGKYAKKGDLLAAGAENMPDDMEPKEFFETLDDHERRNGGAVDTKVALPRVLKPKEQAALAKELALMLAGQSPVAWAVHCPKAALEGGDQPHLHALICGRVPDGIDRPVEQIFKRYNPAAPKNGGWRKDSGGPTYRAMTERLKEQRRKASELINDHLRLHGHSQQVDHRSHKDRGDAAVPGKHLGPKRVWSQVQEQEPALVVRYLWE
jgi:hypothetical protein